MPNREKVIERLESELNRAERNGWKKALVPTECMKDTLALLSEQEPVKPQYVNVRWRDVPRCGACGVGLLDREDNYCHYCGRAVKWDA